MSSILKTLSLPVHLVILREELARRTRANSRYSLRSFAKQLEIDASFLSKILSHQRPLSPNNAVKILERIQIDAREKTLFWQSYVREREETYGQFDSDANALVGTPAQKHEQYLDSDAFKIIAEPHHYAIVELTRIKSFQNNAQWIASVLGISETEVKESIERLILVGLLQKQGSKLIRTPGRHTTADKTITDSALRYHQRKIIEQSIKALDQVSIEKRNQTSMTIAINPKKIPVAKKMMQDFLNQLSDVLESGSVEEVYQISFSLFPVSDVAQKDPL